jgi:DNA polymerase epsilon subunit 4
MPMPIPMSEALELRRQKSEQKTARIRIYKLKESVILDENPTLHEDSPPVPGDGIQDDLPPLALSTNPLYPNAIIKRHPNTHSKGTGKAKAAAPPPANSSSPVAPRVVTGKNAPVGSGFNRQCRQADGYSPYRKVCPREDRQGGVWHM